LQAVVVGAVVVLAVIHTSTALSVGAVALAVALDKLHLFVFTMTLREAFWRPPVARAVPEAGQVQVVSEVDTRGYRSAEAAVPLSLLNVTAALAVSVGPPMRTAAKVDAEISAAATVVTQRGGTMTATAILFGLIQLAAHREEVLTFKVLQAMRGLVALAACLGIIIHREAVAVAVLLAF
jgi:hypothetical protein